MIHLFGKCENLEERKQKIDNVTIEEINRFAKQIASEELFNVVAVGKNIKVEDLEQF